MPTYEMAKHALAGTGLAPFAGCVTGVVSACVRVPTAVLKARLQIGVDTSARAALRGAHRAAR